MAEGLERSYGALDALSPAINLMRHLLPQLGKVSPHVFENQLLDLRSLLTRARDAHH